MTIHIHVHKKTADRKTKDAVSQEDEAKFQACAKAMRAVTTLLTSLEQVKSRLKSGNGSVMTVEDFSEIHARVRDLHHKVY